MHKSLSLLHARAMVKCAGADLDRLPSSFSIERGDDPPELGDGVMAAALAPIPDGKRRIFTLQPRAYPSGISYGPTQAASPRQTRRGQLRLRSPSPPTNQHLVP